jgi:hypothetical protein
MVFTLRGLHSEPKERGVAAASSAHHEIAASRRRRPLMNCVVATEVSLLLALRYRILFRFRSTERQVEGLIVLDHP